MLKAVRAGRYGPTPNTGVGWEEGMQTSAMAAQAAQHFDRAIDPDAIATAIAEPLMVSAPIAFQIAHERCPPPENPASCRGYHAVWQYLRLADQARSLKVDGGLYAATAERLARMGTLRRVLVTATADYSMLAHLAFGARCGGADPVFHIVDRCASALELNRWYGDRMGLKVELTQSDVLQFESAHVSDLVCAHSFVSWVRVEDRPALFGQWRKNLSDEGRLCFTTRVWQDHHRYESAEMDARIEQIVTDTMKALEDRSVPLPCDPLTFAGLLRRYGRRRGEHPPLPLTDIESWMATAGLTVEIVGPAAELIAGTRDHSPGPFPISRGPRMWFQARAA